MYFLYSSVQLKTWQSCKRKHKQCTVRIFIFYLLFLNVKLCLASCWLPDLLTLLLHCRTCLDCSLFCFWVETNICGFYCFLFDIFPLEIQLVKKRGWTGMQLPAWTPQHCCFCQDISSGLMQIDSRFTIQFVISFQALTPPAMSIVITI